MQTWKRILLAAVGFGAGLGILLCIALVAWGWYSSRPKAPKPWDSKAISAEYDGVTTESDTRLGTTFVVYYTLQNNTDFDYQVRDQGEQVLLGGQLEREKSASFDNENLKAEFPLFIPARGRVRFGIHLKYPYSAGAEPAQGIEAIHAYRAKVADYMATEFNNLNGFALYDQEHRYRILFPRGWKKSEPAGDVVKVDIGGWSKAEVLGSCSRSKDIVHAYPVDGQGKEITLSCSLQNQTISAIPFNARPPMFDAILHLPDGSTVKPQHQIYLASAKTEIPGRGQIEGGLFISQSCASNASDDECLTGGLMHAEDLLLTDRSTKARYRISVK